MTNCGLPKGERTVVIFFKVIEGIKKLPENIKWVILAFTINPDDISACKIFLTKVRSF